MNPAPGSAHDEYLAALDDRNRVLLSGLRNALDALLPAAEHVISYKMPGYRLGGKVVAGYAAFSRHCSFFPHSGGILPQFRNDIAAACLSCTKSALHFTVARPIPADLLRQIVDARLNEAGLA